MLFNSINHDLSNPNLNYNPNNYPKYTNSISPQTYQSYSNYQSPQQQFKFSSPGNQKNYPHSKISMRNKNQEHQLFKEFQNQITQLKSPFQQNLRQSNVKSYTSEQQYNRNYTNSPNNKNWFQDNYQKGKVRQYQQSQFNGFQSTIKKKYQDYLPTKQLIVHDTHQQKLNNHHHNYFDSHHIQPESNRLRKINNKLTSTTNRILKKGLIHNNKNSNFANKSSRLSYHPKPTQYIFYQSPSRNNQRQYEAQRQHSATKSKSSHSSNQYNGQKSKSTHKKVYFPDYPTSSYENSPQRHFINSNIDKNHEIINHPQKDYLRSNKNIVMNSPLQHPINPQMMNQASSRPLIQSSNRSHSRSKKDITFNYLTNNNIRSQSSINPSIQVDNLGRDHQYQQENRIPTEKLLQFQDLDYNKGQRQSDFLLMNQQNQNKMGYYPNKPFDKSQKIYFNYLNANQSPSNQQFKPTDLLLLQSSSSRQSRKQQIDKALYNQLSSNYHILNSKQNTFRNTNKYNNEFHQTKYTEPASNYNSNLHIKNLDNDFHMFKKSNSSQNLNAYKADSKSQNLDFQFNKNLANKNDEDDEDVFFDYNQNSPTKIQEPKINNYNVYTGESSIQRMNIQELQAFKQINSNLYSHLNQVSKTSQNPTLGTYSFSQTQQVSPSISAKKQNVLSPLNLTELNQTKNNQKQIPIFKKYLSQIKDKQSKIIAGTLIFFAVLILILQLLA